ncbi:MAG: precorrin-6Y C5,15-methyltransferase (decarboxylating) subunit CbiT [Clostridia bacterium]|nr:precorrin-6Y C5,15-methyltransferase (decarboxylating) subunit CbiT [Clostridia bacterium]
MKDDAFIRGENPMTKMEIRNTIVSYMALEDGQNVLEIGAGTGSVSVQMKKLYPLIHLSAIEKTISGCNLIQANAEKHGVEIDVIHGEAPTNLLNHEVKFDRIYIGGSGKRFVELMNWLESKHMKDGTILVFSVITIETITEIFEYITTPEHCYSDIEASQLNVSRLDKLGGYHYFKPLNPCTVIKCKFGGANV